MPPRLLRRPLPTTMNPPDNSLREATAGLWRNNLSLAQLLGLCPLLAVTTSFVNGLALGVLTTIVLVVANSAMALVRCVLVPAVRVPLYLLLAAALVTSVPSRAAPVLPIVVDELSCVKGSRSRMALSARYISLALAPILP